MGESLLPAPPRGCRLREQLPWSADEDPRRLDEGAGERLRLWLSYQRYALLLFVLGALPAALVAAWAPASLLGWLTAAAVFAGLGGVAIAIARRWPEKRRATRLGIRRIEAGRFHPRQLQNYCGDPCFRVVAAELLTRAGLPRRERRRIIRGYARGSASSSSWVARNGQIPESHIPDRHAVV